jgi:hypothetical protein
MAHYCQSNYSAKNFKGDIDEPETLDELHGEKITPQPQDDHKKQLNISTDN